MSQIINEETKSLIDELGFKADTQKVAATFLEENVIRISPLSKHGAFEDVLVEIDEIGTMVKSTSRKATNLKFHLGKVLLETFATGISLPETTGNEIKFLILFLRYLQKMLELATINIEKQDAEVLLEIHRISHETPLPSVSEIANAIGREFGEEKLARILSNLEMLGCISLSDNNVKLIEKVIVRSVA